MKTVSGKVVSNKPISLSKSSKILSNFISVENGASHSVSIYLKRASSSFTQLVQFHKQLKSPHSNQITTDGKHKNDPSKSEGIDEYKVRKRDKKDKMKKWKNNGEVYDGNLIDLWEQSGFKKKRRKV